MKTKLLLAAGLAAVSMASVAIHQAWAITSNGTTTAEIIQIIDLDCSVGALDFGQIVPAAGASTIALATDGTVTPGGGATHLGGEAVGECDLSGAALPADISVSAFSTLTGPGTAMTLSNFVLDYDGGGEAAAPIVATLDTAGAPLLVGATLNVGAAQVAGTYNGTFTIQVDYQ